MPTVNRQYDIGQMVYTIHTDGRILNGIIESYTIKVFANASGTLLQDITYEIYDSVANCRVNVKEQKILLTYTDALQALSATVNLPYC